ncbi:MAG: C40 family peptidase [Candidatus Fermentibacter sp.]|nr:C40 family peptidase [Candidatus Fermentibacter sp.]
MRARPGPFMSGAPLAALLALAACSPAPVYTGGGIDCRGAAWSAGVSSNAGEPVTGGDRRMMDIIEGWIGTPYRYGGETKDGVDCSGFTQAVFAEMGIAIPRTAGTQAEAARQVQPGDLRFGDIIFFNTSGSGISHCGIYIGDGFFVHASSSRGVVRQSLANPYFFSRIVGAGRFL